MTKWDDVWVAEQAVNEMKCREISTQAMLKVQSLAAGNETTFRYYMTMTIKNMVDHLGMSMAAQLTKEEILGDVG